MREGAFVLVVSDVTTRELAPAPDYVSDILETVPADKMEEVFASEDSTRLQEAYLAAKVVGPASDNDAAHIAVATISLVDIIVSWNFKHIVHYEKIMGYEGINTIYGYKSPRICSPYEVIDL